MAAALVASHPGAMHLPKSIPALKEVARKYMAASSRFAKNAAANEERAEMFIDAALVVGAAAGVSYANGKHGSVYQVAGHDADLLGGAVITLGAILFPNAVGKYTEKAGKIGVGFLTAAAVRAAYAKGQAASQTPILGATSGVSQASTYTAGVAQAQQYVAR